MKKIRIYMMCLVSCAVALFFAACGSSSSDDDGGGGGSGAVGSWKCTSFEGNPNSGFYWHFMEDGTLYLNESSSPGGARTGTYSVSGNHITGNGNNPGVGTFNISFTISGNTFTGIFHEDWGGGKDVPIDAVKI